MNNIKKVFENVTNRYLLVILLLVVLCPILIFSYSAFVFNTSDYRASEMMIGNLMYTMEINNEATSEINLSGRGTTYYDIKISNVNEINTKYILAYKTNNNDVEIYIENDSLNEKKGLINKDQTYIISIVVINPKNNVATIDIGVFGGYVANDYTQINYEDNYEDPLDTTPWDVNILAMTIDGTNVTTLPTTGTYELDSYTCENGEELLWDSMTKKLTTSNVTVAPVVCKVNFKSVSNYTTTLVQKIYNDNTKVASRTNFTTAFTENTTGKIFYINTHTESTCNSGDTLTYVSGSGSSSVCKTYYFAGNTTNNYVTFAGYMWNIVRINEDQSIRLTFLGTNENYNRVDGDSNGIYFPGYIGMASFQSGTILDASTGYMFSNTGTVYEDLIANTRTSGPKGTLDAWYRDNIFDNYNNYVSQTAIYCNDRSFTDGTGTSNSYDNVTYYAGYNRIMVEHVPMFNCPKMDNSTGLDSKHNCFTVSSTTGNGKLNYGIGLITADEYIYAGANMDSSNTNRNFYIQKHNNNWAYTMTPATTGKVFSMTYQGNIYMDNTTTARMIKPVISLKSCVKYVKGNGTADNPYVATIDSTCSSAIN